MEILGLAILFVLVIFGFLLYLMFSSGEKEDTREGFLEPKMASSILNAMIKTSVKCNEGTVYSITDLLKHCADSSFGHITCSEWGDQDACFISHYVITSMLTSTMGQYKLPYWLEVTVGDGQVLRQGDGTEFNWNSERCDKAKKQKKPAYQPIQLTTSTLKVMFGICGS